MNASVANLENKNLFFQTISTKTQTLTTVNIVILTKIKRKTSLMDDISEVLFLVKILNYSLFWIPSMIMLFDNKYKNMVLYFVFRSVFTTFAQNMETTIIEDDIFVFEPFEEDGSVLMAAETPWRGMADELQELHYLKGARFINQLKLIVHHGEFNPVKGETDIYSSISEQSEDFDNLINAARKAVEHGYRVYILPNPRSCRTADFIFEKKGILGLYDLKTVHGKGSVGTQLLDSIGQTNRVLLNMNTDYNARLLSSEIKAYFEANEQAVEVLIFKGKKSISVSRWQVEAPRFNRFFRKKYEK